MSICAHRPETPGFFTPCRTCPCGTEVAAELAAQQTQNEPSDRRESPT